MTTSAQSRTKIVAFYGIVVLSAATMLWLFWRFPVGTAIATVAVLAAFAVSARLARPDVEVRSDTGRDEQNC